VGFAFDVTYRDRAIQCPRCTIDLVRDDDRERWQCRRCSGALLSVAEVVGELVTIAPDLVPQDGIGGLPTLGRRSKERLLACGVCGAEMDPVFLGGVELDRCYHDDMIWFDRGEIERVLEIAADQRSERTSSWLMKLLGG